MIESLLIENGYTIKNGACDSVLDSSSSDKLKNIILVKYSNKDFLVEHNGDFITKVIDGVEITAKKHGYSLSIINVDSNTIVETVSEINSNKSTVGIIFLGTHFNHKNSNILRTLYCPVTIVDSHMGYEDFNCISINDRDGVYKAAKYLYDLGHRSITHIQCSIKIGASIERDLYFDLAAKEIGFDNIQYLNINPDPLLGTKEMFEAIKSKGLKTTAFFATNDLVAIGAIGAFKKAGFKIPEDISIIGFDDISISSIIDPPLTTISICKIDLGRLAVERLLQLVKNQDASCIKTQICGDLIVRKTTAGPSIINSFKLKK